ncbi:MAG: acyl-CoA dehydrogenase [Alphaproteobacteria bacterium]|nr:acyl-CoA dehydrogenase [Alphaproteobacteria bacterium]
MSERVDLSSWVGRERVVSDVVTAERVVQFSATLDRNDPPPKAGDPLPPCWHWMFFQETAPMAEVGPDGHPKRGSFLPPIEKPRRMWAGSRLRFPDPPRVGDTMKRVTRIASVTEKAGKTGSLIFLGLVHEISTARGLAISEEQDIVYRDMPPKGAETPSPPPAPSGAVWRRPIQPDPVLLFRYSALTFNSHRIHYDRSYCKDVEGYPGLIVHGPLTATLLVDLVRRERPDARITSYDFRAVSPLFDTAAFAVAAAPSIDGKTARVWAEAPMGGLAMSGDVGFG